MDEEQSEALLSPSSAATGLCFLGRCCFGTLSAIYCIMISSALGGFVYSYSKSDCGSSKSGMRARTCKALVAGLIELVVLGCTHMRGTCTLYRLLRYICIQTYIYIYVNTFILSIHIYIICI